MSRPIFVVTAVVLLLGLGGAAYALPAAPGDTSSTVTLFANFDADIVGAAPNLTLPGNPPGDFLTLGETTGTVRVNASIDGLTMVAQLKQQNGTGGVSLFAWPAAAPAFTEKVTVGWRSVAQDDNPINIVACTVRGSNGNVIASVEYGPHGALLWNSIVGGTQTLPITYQQNKNNAFQIVVDLNASTVSLAVDGAAVPGFQGVPFAQPATDVARIGFEAGGAAPQTFAADDIYAVAFTRVPDFPPVVTAPATASGSEGAPFSFTVSAADPDGQAITSLTALSLPSGATFTADASNTSGTLSWTPGFNQAGSYSVLFLASNNLSGSATTAITIAPTDRPPVVQAPASAAVEELGILSLAVSASDPDGDAIDALTADLSGLPAGNTATFTAGPGNTSGTLSWSPALGQAGDYPAVFQATANGASGTATTDLFVAALGTSVTGRFIWATKPGEEGTYTVTFTATDLGGISTLPISLTVYPPGPTATTAPGRAAASPGELAPQSPMKGPIISYNGKTSTASGSTITGTTTAASSITLARRIVRAASPTAQRAAAQGPITLGADLSGLPTGNTAMFVIDEDPIVSAPATKQGDVGLPLTVNVGASDPDADPILALTADLTGLPSGNNASFTTNASNTLGTLSWTPAMGDSGNYTVTFHATNRLVGSASTVIHVRGTAAASVFTAGSRKLNLGSGKPFYNVAIEPVGGSFQLMDVDPLSVVMISPGTGSVGQIGIAPKTQGLIGDRDNDAIADMTVSFAKADLRTLFSLLRGNNSVPVLIRGNLMSGGRFQGSMSIDVNAGGGRLAATLIPNPLNPQGVLRFMTSRPGEVSVRLYDVSGRMIREILPRETLAAGEHEVTIRGEDASGRRLASGVYFYRVEAREGTSVGRVAVVK